MEKKPEELRDDGYCKDVAQCYSDDDFRRTHK